MFCSLCHWLCRLCCAGLIWGIAFVPIPMTVLNSKTKDEFPQYPVLQSTATKNQN